MEMTHGRCLPTHVGIRPVPRCPVMLPLKLERGQYGGGRHRPTPRDVFGGLVPDVHQITVTRAHARDNRTAEGSPPSMPRGVSLRLTDSPEGRRQNQVSGDRALSGRTR